MCCNVQLIFINFGKHSPDLGRDTYLAPEGFKQKGVRIYPILVGGTGNRVADDLSCQASCFNCATNVFNYEQLLDVAEEIASYIVKDLCVDFAN